MDLQHPRRCYLGICCTTQPPFHSVGHVFNRYALIEKGFRTLGVSKVVATAMATNARSRRVMEKAGLQFEKEFVYPGDPFPGWHAGDCLEVKYGLTKDRWECIRSH